MQVAFRADASTAIGSGHVMRCLTLAHELRTRRVHVVFVCREEPGHFLGRIADDGFDVVPLPADDDVDEERDATETRSALGAVAPDGIVVDHYRLGALWERTMRAAGARILAVDDIERAHEADLLLDQNWSDVPDERRYADVVPPHTVRLMGPRFALLRREYAALRAALPPRDGIVRRVLVSFGASDPSGQTAAVVGALSAERFAHMQVDVVIGANAPDASAIEDLAARRARTATYHNVPTLAELLSKADLAIGAGGTTTWERACLRVPAIVAVLFPNQEGPARRLAAAGCQLLAGDGSQRLDEADWREIIADAMADPERLCRLGAVAGSLTDGLGVHRVARAMLGGGHRTVTVRPATLSDAPLLLAWANDPAVRANSFSPAWIEPAGHDAWLRARLVSGWSLLLIGEDERGVPVGQVRFDRDGTVREAHIDISVDPTMRGAGVGARLLEEALAVAGQRWPDTRPVAEVRDGNEASAHLFLGRGFRETPRRRPGARCFVLPAESGVAGWRVGAR